METIQCMETRRSIRRFENRPVDASVVKKIIKAASTAPSWKNTQTVRYFILAEPERKAAFADACCAVHMGNCERAKGCGALIVLVTVRRVSGYNADSTPTTPLGSHWESFDAGIAAQTLCLAAQDAGLGTLIMGLYDPQKAAQELSLPEDMQVSALIALGYPAEEPAARPRKCVEELLTWVR